MLKTSKYILSIILFAGLLFITSNFALAQTSVPAIQYAKGATCGTGAQGTCKQFCDAYENIDSTPTSGSGTGPCGSSDSGQALTCCVPTRCGSNSIGIGNCISGTSCSGINIGINTSDCVPPKLCCVVPGVQNSNNGQTTVIQTSNQTNVFTGETNSNLTTSGNTGSTGGLVPCLGWNPTTKKFDCTLCDLFILLKNIINFLTGFVFAIAAGFVVWGSIEIMTSGGAEGKITEGRGRIMTAVIGIAITLGAWLFIGTLLQILTNSPSKLPWNTIQCVSSPLNLKSYSTGDNSACTALKGVCQDKSVTCASNNWSTGKCLLINSVNYQCCLPSTSSSSTNNGSNTNTVPTCARGKLTNIQSTGTMYCKLGDPLSTGGTPTICPDEFGIAFKKADGTIDGCGEAVQNKPI